MHMTMFSYVAFLVEYWFEYFHPQFFFQFHCFVDVDFRIDLCVGVFWVVNCVGGGL